MLNFGISIGFGLKIKIATFPNLRINKEFFLYLYTKYDFL